MRIPRVSQFVDVVLKHAGGQPETGKQVVVALGCVFFLKLCAILRKILQEDEICIVRAIE